MKLTEVLVKPLLTEKANAQQDKLRRYAFKVARKANKLEIKKAIQEFYGVTVTEVNTAVIPGKNKMNGLQDRKYCKTYLSTKYLILTSFKWH